MPLEEEVAGWRSFFEGREKSNKNVPSYRGFKALTVHAGCEPGWWALAVETQFDSEGSWGTALAWGAAIGQPTKERAISIAVGACQKQRASVSIGSDVHRTTTCESLREDRYADTYSKDEILLYSKTNTQVLVGDPGVWQNKCLPGEKGKYYRDPGAEKYFGGAVAEPGILSQPNHEDFSDEPSSQNPSSASSGSETLSESGGVVVSSEWKREGDFECNNPSGKGKRYAVFKVTISARNTNTYPVETSLMAYDRGFGIECFPQMGDEKEPFLGDGFSPNLVSLKPGKSWSTTFYARGLYSRGHAEPLFNWSGGGATQKPVAGQKNSSDTGKDALAAMRKEYNAKSGSANLLNNLMEEQKQQEAAALEAERQAKAEQQRQAEIRRQQAEAQARIRAQAAARERAQQEALAREAALARARQEQKERQELIDGIGELLGTIIQNRNNR